jgi:hypothetical protein
LRDEARARRAAARTGDRHRAAQRADARDVDTRIAGVRRRDAECAQALLRLGRDTIGRPGRREFGVDTRVQNTLVAQRVVDRPHDRFGRRTARVRRRDFNDERRVVAAYVAHDAELDDRHDGDLGIGNRRERSPCRRCIHHCNPGYAR